MLDPLLDIAEGIGVVARKLDTWWRYKNEAPVLTRPRDRRASASPAFALGAFAAEALEVAVLPPLDDAGFRFLCLPSAMKRGGFYAGRLTSRWMGREASSRVWTAPNPGAYLGAEF